MVTVRLRRLAGAAVLFLALGCHHRHNDGTKLTIFPPSTAPIITATATRAIHSTCLSRISLALPSLSARCGWRWLVVVHDAASNRVGWKRQPATQAGEHRTRVALRGRNAAPHLAQV
jgi:hypothetical protein